MQSAQMNAADSVPSPLLRILGQGPPIFIILNLKQGGSVIPVWGDEISQIQSIHSFIFLIFTGVYKGNMNASICVLVQCGVLTMAARLDHGSRHQAIAVNSINMEMNTTSRESVVIPTVKKAQISCSGKKKISQGPHSILLLLWQHSWLWQRMQISG